MRHMESRFSEDLGDGTMKCIICPRMCIIKPNQRGFCGTKENQNGKIISLTYGRLSAIAVDPIEKKPLAHFYPGSLSLSVSSVGCSFTCPWCQNWHLSTGKPEDQSLKFMTPREVVQIAQRQNCTSIAYTYNEPLINLNYVEDVARLAREKDIKNVLVTNGYISKQALSRVVDVIDAVNVDWKAFNEKFYQEHCSADLQSVLNATEEMKNNGVHVEVTFLIIPDTNDDPDETRSMARYLVDHLGEDTPLHLSRFYPQYKFSHIPPTPVETLLKAREIALNEGVKYVYVGNIRTEYESTYCPSCGKPVVERSGYNVTGWKLDSENRCSYCGTQIPIVGRMETHRTSFF